MPLRTVGVIGTGIMGLPMARHLAEAGYPLKVYNRTRAKAASAKAFGAQIVGSPREAATDVSVLITMVTDPQAIEKVMQGRDGFLSSPSLGVTWIQMSTLDIESVLSFSKKTTAKGWHFVDCPVTGSKKQVEEAELILLAGAEDKDLSKIRPLLSRLGKTIVHAGPVGAGTALKLCMNLIVAQMTTGLAEAVALGEATGVRPEHILEVLRKSPALDCGYFRIKGQAILNKDFSPAFSLANMLKDVRFISQAASKHGTKLPVNQAVCQLLERSSREGYSEQDLMAVCRVLSRKGSAR
jgi:3-hydroxyisobutyrate dehydrogenase-like beta-hydroxyacid dehydrogenase